VSPPYAIDRGSPRHEPAARWLEHAMSGTETVGLAWLRELLSPLGTAGNLTGDAHLAALAIEHGATIHSCDADFGRFSGARWIDPLPPPTP
jgi:predicted nucleic acid-binding protein